MGHSYSVHGIDNMPVYLISSTPPWTFSTEDFISGVPLRDLLDRLNPDENLYFVDYASAPGTARVTLLA